MAKRLFLMISTRVSAEYTEHALRSFFTCTELTAADRFLLVDNDACLSRELLGAYPVCELIQNSVPKSFAENANAGISIALRESADLVLLNNDVIFTPRWFKPLELDIPAIISSVSNQVVQYEIDGFNFKRFLDLQDYLDHQIEFEKVLEIHGRNPPTYITVMSAPFFCVKIPFEILNDLGMFDASFGFAGAEDADYCLRAYLKSYAVLLAGQSLVLHFEGKSTWRGSETKAETLTRNEQYFKAFSIKWHESLANYFLKNNYDDIADQNLKLLLDNRQFSLALRTIARQLGIKFDVWQPRVAAIMPVYRHDPWMKFALASIYKHCEKIFIVVNEKPWHGEISNEGLFDAKEISSDLDPAGKIEVLRGNWDTEAQQRNYGLELSRELGIDYCLIIDSDEIYDEAVLKRIIFFAASQRHVPTWRIQCLTYWKTLNYVIDPPENYKPIVLVKSSKGKFKQGRETEEELSSEFPLAFGVCHHLSYVRSDAEVLAKIGSFSHAAEVVPGWFENVWLAWDRNPDLQNLNPCWPEAFGKAIKQDPKKLPKVLVEIAADLASPESKLSV